MLLPAALQRSRIRTAQEAQTPGCTCSPSRATGPPRIAASTWLSFRSQTIATRRDGLGPAARARGSGRVLVRPGDDVLRVGDDLVLVGDQYGHGRLAGELLHLA